MSYMIELYYQAPADPGKETDIALRVGKLGGRLDLREEPDVHGPQSICLTFEFDTLSKAESAVDLLRRDGEHIEGPVEYAAD